MSECWCLSSSQDQFCVNLVHLQLGLCKSIYAGVTLSWLPLYGEMSLCPSSITNAAVCTKRIVDDRYSPDLTASNERPCLLRVTFSAGSSTLRTWIPCVEAFCLGSISGPTVTVGDRRSQLKARPTFVPVLRQISLRTLSPATRDAR
jgi:hypothetical protein